MTRRNESKRVVTVCVAIFLVLLMMVEKTHQKASTVRSCLRSCHHCKNHFGNFFVAHLCAKTCTDLRGRLEINCKDIVSIAPFLDPMVLQHLSNNNIWFKNDEKVKISSLVKLSEDRFLVFLYWNFWQFSIFENRVKSEPLCNKKKLFCQLDTILKNVVLNLFVLNFFQFALTKVHPRHGGLCPRIQ